MRELRGLRVCMSGDRDGDGTARGEIGEHIAAKLREAGATFVVDDLVSADVAICTFGRMTIAKADSFNADEIRREVESNYVQPVIFVERASYAMVRAARGGLIVCLGSNAAWYGNVGAEHYAASKAALRKYLEIRRRTLREYGIRVACVGFGGVATRFWEKATAGADPALAAGIVPGSRAPLTADEAAEYVLSLIRLPENVAVPDALVLSTQYQ